jgi:multidrug efflux pump subunit AcrB
MKLSIIILLIISALVMVSYFGFRYVPHESRASWFIRNEIKKMDSVEYDRHKIKQLRDMLKRR